MLMWSVVVVICDGHGHEANTNAMTKKHVATQNMMCCCFPKCAVGARVVWVGNMGIRCIP